MVLRRGKKRFTISDLNIMQFRFIYKTINELAGVSVRCFDDAYKWRLVVVIQSPKRITLASSLSSTSFRTILRILFCGFFPLFFSSNNTTHFSEALKKNNTHIKTAIWLEVIWLVEDLSRNFLKTAYIWIEISTEWFKKNRNGLVCMSKNEPFCFSFV